MPETDASAPHRKPVRLARAALDAAVNNRPQAAGRAVHRIAEECGVDGLVAAVFVWCDTFQNHAFDGDMRPQVFTTPARFWETDTGLLDDSDSARVPAQIGWAGRMLTARMGRDTDEIAAVLAELEDNPQAGEYLTAVLQVAAEALTHLPRGYLRMANPNPREVQREV